MEMTDWFTIKELAKLNTATIIWKTIYMKTPMKLHENLDYDNNTLDINTKEPRLQFTRANFSYRASIDWNAIPRQIREIKNISRFKKNMKMWIKDLRPRTPD